MNSSPLLGLGLTTTALLSLAALPALAGGTHDNYTVSFTTPSPFLGIGSGDVLFQFNPDGSGAPAASVTGSGLNYSSGWSVNLIGIKSFGDTSIDFFGPSVTINNTDTKNGFDVPVTSWGTTFGFNLDYVDPPGTTPSDFSVTLQKAGLNDLTLFDIQFNPAGQPALLSTTPGVTITPQTGTPPLGNPPVPEASTTVSFGLLLLLGGLTIVAKRKKSRTAA